MEMRENVGGLSATVDAIAGTRRDRDLDRRRARQSGADGAGPVGKVRKTGRGERI